jgi:mRNA-degrading endonuclease RelE of RelBE toxin-antitoxin system
MVTIAYEPKFQRFISKIKDSVLKEKIIKQIEKIVLNPETGKPMRYERIGSREVYVSPYRLSYLYNKTDDKIILLDIYHKDGQ